MSHRISATWSCGWSTRRKQSGEAAHILRSRRRGSSAWAPRALSCCVGSLCGSVMLLSRMSKEGLPSWLCGCRCGWAGVPACGGRRGWAGGPGEGFGRGRAMVAGSGGGCGRAWATLLCVVSSCLAVASHVLLVFGLVDVGRGLDSVASLTRPC